MPLARTTPEPFPAAESVPPVIVRADGLGKRFRLYRQPSDRLKEWLTASHLKLHDDFWAVRGVTFEIRRGECLGVIGANGSGKSTLLKVLSGTMTPTEGSFGVHGRVLSLLELGTGLHDLLTGRQNVHNAARLLAFPPGFAAEKLDEIRAFADLGDFFDRPVRLYSSGMRVRLAFSMFACFRPEVFIVDEALSVGDVFFQQKCVRRIDEMLESGTTMLFVSHDMNKVQRLSRSAILMDAGRIAFAGPSEEAVSRYYAKLGGAGRVAPRPAARPGAARAPRPPAPSRDRIRAASLITPGHSRHGTGLLTIDAAMMEDDAGKPTRLVEMMSVATISILLNAHHDVEAPTAGIHIYDRLSNLVFAAGTRQLGFRIGPMRAGEERVLRFRITMAVDPAEYTFSLGCGEPSPEGPDAGVVHDRIEGLGPFRVSWRPGEMRPFYGIARLPMEIESPQ